MQQMPRVTPVQWTVILQQLKRDVVSPIPPTPTIRRIMTTSDNRTLITSDGKILTVRG